MEAEPICPWVCMLCALKNKALYPTGDTAAFLSITFQNFLRGMPTNSVFGWSMYLRVTDIPNKPSLAYWLQ